jgi:hypothetical protein
MRVSSFLRRAPPPPAPTSPRAWRGRDEGKRHPCGLGISTCLPLTSSTTNPSWSSVTRCPRSVCACPRPSVYCTRYVLPSTFTPPKPAHAAGVSEETLRNTNVMTEPTDTPPRMASPSASGPPKVHRFTHWAIQQSRDRKTIAGLGPIRSPSDVFPRCGCRQCRARTSSTVFGSVCTAAPTRIIMARTASTPHPVRLHRRMVRSRCARRRSTASSVDVVMRGLLG